MPGPRLSGKIAVVTGGGSGIGAAICKKFVDEGADLAILEVDPEKFESNSASLDGSGRRVSLHACDVADLGQVNAAMDAVVDQHGRLDILVNNAGISHIGNVEVTTPEDMDRVYAVNVKGVYHCTQAAIGKMLANGGGAILNLASILSRLGVPDRFAYSMSKGAVLAMTLSVARDYIDRNIRCNCICPSRVHTPFVDGYLAKHYPGREKEMFDTLSAFQPIGRMGTPEEVASIAAFLCSDEAAFITGSAHDIDGGVMNLR